MMTVPDRTDAIARAQRAMKALVEHPETTQKQLGHARDRVNDCYRLADGDSVWKSVRSIEASAAYRYGAAAPDEHTTNSPEGLLATEHRQAPVMNPKAPPPRVSRCSRD